MNSPAGNHCSGRKCQRGMLVRFQGMTPASKGGEGSGDLWPPEPAPLARRRPGYSSSGCTPAEPDSASPGITNVVCVCPASKKRWPGVRANTCSSFLKQTANA
jgi:hypothetical protein